MQKYTQVKYNLIRNFYIKYFRKRLFLVASSTQVSNSSRSSVNEVKGSNYSQNNVFHKIGKSTSTNISSDKVESKCVCIEKAIQVPVAKEKNSEVIENKNVENEYICPFCKDTFDNGLSFSHIPENIKMKKIIKRK